MFGIKSKKKILVADDEQPIRQLASQILSPEYEVLEAVNGKDAVVTTQKDRPDAVLMDMIMPEMDGLTACYAIKNNARTSQIPVIIIAALDTAANRSVAREIWKADGYIGKPFDAKILIDTIEQSLKSGQPSN